VSAKVNAIMGYIGLMDCKKLVTETLPIILQDNKEYLKLLTKQCEEAPIVSLKRDGMTKLSEKRMYS
jgi:hypothetical protein